MFERFSASARDTVMRAREEAIRLRDRQIGSEHLLLAMLDSETGSAAAALREVGVDATRVHGAVVGEGKPARLLSNEDAAALRSIGIDLDNVVASIERTFGTAALANVPTGRGKQPSRIRLSAGARKLLGQALREAVTRGHNALDSGHILLAMVSTVDDRAGQILAGAGVPLDELRTVTLSILDREVTRRRKR